MDGSSNGRAVALYLVDPGSNPRSGSGVLQGGILSPMVFTIYTSDLQYWVKKAKIFNYADDTTSGCSAKELEKVLKDLEADADIIISYMESNGLMVIL